MVTLIFLPCAVAQTTSFQISIPQKGTNISGGFPPIGTVQVYVTVASGAQVQFTIKPDPFMNGTQSVTAAPTSAPFNAVSPGNNPPPSLTFLYSDLTSGRHDTVSLTPPAAAVTTGGPATYKIDFHLAADFINCAAQQPTRTFTIQVRKTDPQIAAVCIDCFDAGTTALGCVPDSSYLVPLGGSRGPVATVVGQPAQTQSCQRLPIDVVMVLDKSGSMASSTTGTSTQPKIASLQNAVKTFVDVWDGIRQQEGNTIADQIGVVLFDSAAKWWGDPTLNTGLVLGQDMNSIDTSNNPNMSISSFLQKCITGTGSCGELVPGTSTSVGAGLVLGNKGLQNDTNRHAILLMTDGLQNTDPKVAPVTPGNTEPLLYCDAPSGTFCTNSLGVQNCTLSAPCPLHQFSASPAPPRATIYSVTVGLGPGVSDGSVIQPIATNSGGFFMNTETNAPLLSPMFLELLQNFLKFFSYDTVRMISEPTPYSATIPISTTSHNVVFTVTWPSEFGSLRLTATPPGNAQPIVRVSASGFISVVQPLPLPGPLDPLGDWKVQVDVPPSTDVSRAPTTNAVPFNLHVMTDDAGIESELSIVPEDYKAGDRIRLRARLTRFGLPVLGLGSHSGDILKARLLKPGQSIGDMLSDSRASGVASSGPDPQSAAENKLANILQNSPSSLKPDVSDSVQLVEDGKGDGTYTALYTATLPGHYNFLFWVESTDPNSVRFSRQQLRTAYVRAVPDAGNTVFQTSILRQENRNVLSINMTPRFKQGPGCIKSDPKCGRMGPGWANYFWFTSPGVAPFKAKDNLDGSYTASLVFTGAFPPPVSVGFEDILAVIDDSVTFDNLPAKPTPLVDHISGPGKWAVFVDAGAAVPHGTLSNAFNTGFSLNAGLEYIATSQFSVEGILGYHDFPAKVGNRLDLYQFSANGKFYLTSGGPFRPFVNGGIGGYKFSPGSTYFGGNFGAGVLREFGPHWGLQASYNFHAVNTPGAATKFSTFQGGIRFVF